MITQHNKIAGTFVDHYAKILRYPHMKNTAPGEDTIHPQNILGAAGQ